MNKRGELNANGHFPEITIKTPATVRTPTIPIESRQLLKRRIAELLAEMKLGSGKVIATFQALCKEMLEVHYEVSWGYGKLYPLEKLKEATAFLLNKTLKEYRLLFEGKVIFLSGGFFKTQFPLSRKELEQNRPSFRPSFRALSQALAKGVHLTNWLLPREEPEFVAVYIFPTIRLLDLTKIYFVLTQKNNGNLQLGGIAGSLAEAKDLSVRLTADLLRKEMLHLVAATKELQTRSGILIKR